MPRAISLSVKGAAGVGDVFAGVKAGAVAVPPGVGVGLTPAFVEAGAREQLLRISSRQPKINIAVRVCVCWRMSYISSDLAFTPTHNYVLEYMRGRRNPPFCICDWKHILDIIA